ncbi:hypothetical protein FF36_05345 [Frankia torreyi]|uniref:Uncharacterized protein n=1 Tax=Frankia torreyi TaxID=1856 RepID=A0A0D8B867_9ACTN|nr:MULTISPECIES: hypothetical protein [Frankia]KJE20371.1 hypothetical protein FF36_05345 [Frankia torreyi]KQM02725.1 hypothetical protein FF86_105717 [Frankia sp. CpI1-P]
MTGRQQTRPTRVEVTEAGVEVYAPYDRDLIENLRALPGATYVVAHWEVPEEHLADVVEFVEEIFGPTSVVGQRGPW